MSILKIAELTTNTFQGIKASDVPSADFAFIGNKAKSIYLNYQG